MAFARGRFGIEYSTDRRDDDSSGLLPWALGIAAIIAVVSLVATVVSRVRDGGSGSGLVEALQGSPAAVDDEPGLAQPSPPAESASPAKSDEGRAELPPPEKIETGGPARRPAKVTNLLMRLEAAEAAHDIAMAIETIERLRALPGDQAADIDDSLARRLGVLNMRRLFGDDKSPWTAEVVVKRGATASRIAYENGSTLASLKKLNGGDMDRLRVGQKLKVFDHPRFTLAIHRRARTADLSLNGKFFKRYYLEKEVTGKVGAYEIPEWTGQLWKDTGVSLKPEDRAELEMLLPKGAQVLIAEL